MNDSVLKRFGVTNDNTETDGDGQDDFGSFGWLRGVRDRAVMLELRHKDGHVSAFGYAWLERAEFDPSEGITLSFGGKTVRITGRNLDSEFRPNVRLFAGIVRHRVPWIAEADGHAVLESTAKGLLIERIGIT